jgi:hypothetical protein
LLNEALKPWSEWGSTHPKRIGAMKAELGEKSLLAAR